MEPTANLAVAAASVRPARIVPWRLILCLLTALILIGAGPSARALTANGFRLGNHGASGVRIVIEVDRPTTFKVDAVNGPPRLIVDLPVTDFQLPQWIPNAPKLAKGFRFGRFDTSRSRLVVDMTRPFRVVQSFMLPPTDGGHVFRIVIDVEDVRDMPATGSPGGPPVAALTPPDRHDDAPAVQGEAKTPLPHTPVQPKPRKKPLVVIDPGHGGVDPGTAGVNGVDEKILTLKMGLELRRTLLATGRYRVAMTRDKDVYVPLRDRLKIARQKGGDLFISLHADSIANPATRGLSVYTLSDKSSDAEAAKLAANENQADILAGADLSYQDPIVAGILLELSQRGTMNASIDFADRLVQELGKVTNLLRRTRRFAGFVVLKSPEIPSVLIELGYLSNRDDARHLTETNHRARLCNAILKGVDHHFGFTN
ncbi:N-acetylmuramoyl-L-alanine amidase [Arboricoccus pini]|uniref:N-acetylmuramoyl-L-alanine amidase n=1 Tax=Arboricoccus pini TaxID=1963835 RepID=A0A212R5K6_9PROT|nr:N-acetylmuramoyl-L-alanine amidase [Arboricoccus pini]